MRARDQCSIFSTGGKFHSDYGLLLELHALTLVTRSYPLLMSINHIFLKKGRPRFYTQSPTAQDLSDQWVSYWAWKMSLSRTYPIRVSWVLVSVLKTQRTACRKKQTQGCNQSCHLACWVTSQC